MTNTLDQWQQLMERHFAALAKSRKQSNLPTFVLEHGLDAVALEEISSKLRSRLLDGERLASHWLLWAIYAAEQGYTYEGGEYWQSFEQATPGWDGGFRYRISDWFSRFHDTYNGFKPSGPWASHFSIIAWPITHAVLPRYLQRQFAQTLYALRFQLARIDNTSPSAIGRLIASNVYGASTRFEQFLEQDELVGRLVLALLQDGEDTSAGPLLPATLNRIVGDLETIRNARGWLKETSRVASGRFKGIANRPLGASANAFPTTATRSPTPDVRASIRLHFKGENHWNVQIDIPSFKEVGALYPEIRQFLKKSRCFLNGSPARKPPGWLLSSRRQAILRDWPNPDEPLVGFEGDNGTLKHLLESECRMTRGPIWLFRVGRDGIAREIIGRIVRPEQRYIVVSDEPLEAPDHLAEQCSINCSKAYAIKITVPDVPSEDHMAWFKAMGISLARTVHVWPTGFPGRNWDGDGQGEWLTTDTPQFGIRADHLVDSFEITLNGSESLRVDAKSDGGPTFIKISKLPVGRHLLVVKAYRGGRVDDRQPPHEGFLEIRVREAVPWVPGTASHAGLVAWSEPYDASLDQFWENEVRLHVVGPSNATVVPHVVLRDASDSPVFAKQVCGPVPLPMKPTAWEERFSNFLRREECAWNYLNASSGTLELDGAELGKYVLRFEHELHPLRWVLQNRDDGVIVRLVDETGQEDAERKCYFLNMERPLQTKKVSFDSAKSGLAVEQPGGMYVAMAGRNRDVIVISNGLTGEGLEGLGVHPDHGHISDSPKEIARLFRVLRFWQKARIAGYLVSARRRQVTDVIKGGITGVTTGWDWARTEAKLRDSAESKHLLDRLQTMVARQRSFATAIRLNASQAARDNGSLDGWFVDLAARYQISSDERQAKFALDMAYRPEALPLIYKESFVELIQSACENQSLLRGARFAFLCSALSSDQTEFQTSEAVA